MCGVNDIFMRHREIKAARDMKDAQRTDVTLKYKF